MTIEVALLISGISLAFSIYCGLSSLKRSEKSDAKADASQLTTVIVKLENISSGVTEIKTEMTNVKSDIRETREKVVKLEEGVKQAQRRIDSFERFKRLGDSDGEE